MNILLNGLPITVGGGRVKFDSFVRHLNQSQVHKTKVVIHPRNAPIYNAKNFPNLSFTYCSYSPASFKDYFKARRFLNELESEFAPDYVITLFGPSFWRPKAKHLMGYAIPHYVYPESPFFKSLSLRQRLTHEIRKRIKTWHFKNNADLWYTESEEVSKRLRLLLNVDPNKVYTVWPQNHPIFQEPEKRNRHDKLIILTVSAYYPHKNFGIFPNVIRSLCEIIGEENFTFFTTLEHRAYNRISSGAYPQWKNLGPVKVEQLPFLYSSASIMFLPTLLECFSASYTEAMAMGVPVLTSDLAFARDNCKKGACYVDPLDSKAIAENIVRLHYEKDFRDTLIVEGKRRLEELTACGRPEDRYIEILEETV